MGRKKNVPVDQPEMISDKPTCLDEFFERLPFDWSSMQYIINLLRDEPKVIDGQNASGFQARTHQPFDEKWIQGTHGGGTYHVVVWGPNPDLGRPTILSSYYGINIAGRGKLPAMENDKDEPEQSALPQPPQIPVPSGTEVQTSQQEMISKAVMQAVQAVALTQRLDQAQFIQQQPARDPEDLGKVISDVVRSTDQGAIVSSLLDARGTETKTAKEQLEMVVKTYNTQIADIRQKHADEKLELRDHEKENTERRVGDLEREHKRTIGEMEKRTLQSEKRAETAESKVVALEGEVKDLEKELRKGELTSLELKMEAAAARESRNSIPQRDTLSDLEKTVGQAEKVMSLFGRGIDGEERSRTKTESFMDIAGKDNVRRWMGGFMDRILEDDQKPRGDVGGDDSSRQQEMVDRYKEWRRGPSGGEDEKKEDVMAVLVEGLEDAVAKGVPAKDFASQIKAIYPKWEDIVSLGHSGIVAYLAGEGHHLSLAASTYLNDVVRVA